MIAAKRPNARPLFFPAAEVKVVIVREESLPARRAVIDEPKHIRALWSRLVATASWYDEEKEHLVCFSLDTRLRLKSYTLVSIGSLNESIASPREIFRPAIVSAAHSIIVAHNHPSGDPSPSMADIDLTECLYQASEILHIPLLDHVIIGGRKEFSFRSVPNLWDKLKLAPKTKKRRRTTAKIRAEPLRSGRSYGRTI